MDSRWRNLGVLLVLIVVIGIAWALFSTGTFFGGPIVSEVTSFESGAASLQSLLAGMPVFDIQNGSFQTTNASGLQAAQIQLQDFQSQIEAKDSFEGKEAVLALTLVWLARADLAIAWNQLQFKNQAASFSGTESDEVVCSQRSFFVSLQEPLINAQNALTAVEQAHNSFAANFPSQANQIGFEETIDLSEGIAGLQNQLASVNEILGDCS
ncbi:hypothetical protein KKE06_06130 [Candidatus Micrarchaeota archaeon]|nr:hypothetical protein [Candidatus Micrarchaeota archaeon]MBU1931014.1 hypothetical protein [Candidatus Micrarchaeota archaeon]